MEKEGISKLRLQLQYMTSDILLNVSSSVWKYLNPFRKQKFQPVETINTSKCKEEIMAKDLLKSVKLHFVCYVLYFFPVVGLFSTKLKFNGNIVQKKPTRSRQMVKTVLLLLWNKWDIILFLDISICKVFTEAPQQEF